MKTAIITRFHYANEISETRIKMIEEFYIPSLINQVDKDFDIILIVHENTLEQIKKIDFKGLNITYILKNNVRFPENIDYINDTILPYNIQIRLDSDDWINPNFIKKVKSLWKNNVDTLITFHPDKFIYETKKQYKHRRHYSEKCPSMFTAICQVNPKIYIYSISHDRLHTYFKKRIYVDERDFCKLVIHKENIFSKP